MVGVAPMPGTRTLVGLRFSDLEYRNQSQDGFQVWSHHAAHIAGACPTKRSSSDPFVAQQDERMV
jgi:hypothetical protein